MPHPLGQQRRQTVKELLLCQEVEGHHGLGLRQRLARPKSGHHLSQIQGTGDVVDTGITRCEVHQRATKMGLGQPKPTTGLAHGLKADQRDHRVGGVVVAQRDHQPQCLDQRKLRYRRQQ